MYIDIYCLNNHAAPTAIYTLSLHDALPICHAQEQRNAAQNVYRSVEHDQKTGLTTFGQFSGRVQQTNKECRDRKSGSAGMPRPRSYAVFCLKKKRGNTTIFTGVSTLFRVRI